MMLNLFYFGSCLCYLYKIAHYEFICLHLDFFCIYLIFSLLVISLFFLQNDVSGLPVFHQALLSNFTKPIPVVEALASLISYFRNPVSYNYLSMISLPYASDTINYAWSPHIQQMWFRLLFFLFSYSYFSLITV